jgi:hypothetical protein
MLAATKRLLKQTPIYSLIVERRVVEARRFLKYANIYPESLDDIIGDYQFAISRDYRGIMQVVNIEECVRATKKLNGAFVETGVFTGGASAFALRSMLRNNAVREYWGFDSFEGMPLPTRQDGEHAIAWAGDDPRTVNAADYDACLAYLRLSGYPENRIHLIKGWFSETLPKANIGPIAILRLDGDFYESTKTALQHLYHLVVPAGIVIIDDYGSFEGCRTAVDELLGTRFLHYVENGIRFLVK